MNLAYVNEQAKGNSGVNYLLVRQDLSDRTLDARRLETNNSQETVSAFLTLITKYKLTKIIWVDKRTEFAGEFEKI